MSRLVSVYTNEHGHQVMSRSGRLLCSPRDPVREAQGWLSRQKIAASDQRILVLGLGAAYHLKELLVAYPQVQVHVLELNEETRMSQGEWLEQESTRVAVYSSVDALFKNNYNLILSFRPAWSQYEVPYVHALLFLTQKSDEALLQAAEAEGLAKTASLLKNRQVPFTLKDLHFLGEDGSHTEIKVWRCLRELVE
jgi:hypothetical protein